MTDAFHRINRAMMEHYAREGGFLLPDCAIAGLSAIREPDESMLASPAAARLVSRVGRVAVVAAWQDMINAIITPPADTSDPGQPSAESQSHSAE